MRMLLCSPVEPQRGSGAAKVWLEVADALRGRGARVELAGPTEVGAAPPPSEGHDGGRYAEALRAYLRRVAGEFDVVEFGDEQLPYARDELAARPLMVARSVLLVHHLERMVPRRRWTARGIAGEILWGRTRARRLRERIARATATLRAADLVNVPNEYDRAELIRRGLDGARIAVVPYGLSAARRAEFERVCGQDRRAPVVGFVGTFDWRKGAADWQAIARRIVRSVPDARLRLVGTEGMMRGEAGVLRWFERRLRGRIEVVPRFEPEALPKLLADVSVGVFPSYVEGFGFGVLEMLAAGVPVVAYDTPGPPMMLPPEWLAPRGDAAGLADRAVALLALRDGLADARRDARAIAARFDWDHIAVQTIATYEAAIARRSRNADAGG